MISGSLQPALPWVGSPEEERRFRRILAASVLLFLLLGVVVARLELPQIDRDELSEPLRIAHILAETITRPTGTEAAPRRARAPTPAPRSAVRAESEPPAATSSEPAPAAVAAAPPPAPVEPVAKPKSVKSRPPGAQDKGAEVAAPRQEPLRSTVERYGVLALSDSLAELRRSAPKIATDRVGTDSQGVGELAAAKPQPTADITRGSGGLGADGPSLEQLTGAPELREELIAGTGPGLVTGSGEGTAGPATGDLRKTRSEDEIQEILNRHKRAIYRIYNRELRKNPSLRGKVVVSITIAPAGEVTGSRVVYSELKAESLEQKLILLIKRIDFGAKPGVPTVTTRVPIEFFPV
ncbi:TonB family protein [Motiliproteus coralliicola]|uniref:TonB family protein n=1 Tax=Motiliproteus coralliicola TaxID=2283196 RepID=A0A369WNZ6_9GAMM|nr:AgmX/PglI C-terminal domain-containing protein [Motiliproteus coralliicola]RDE22943.1 TonB family protein [Motiliproteus coralliicola]